MNSKNIFFAFFLFGLLVFACKNKEKTPISFEVEPRKALFPTLQSIKDTLNRFSKFERLFYSQDLDFNLCIDNFEGKRIGILSTLHLYVFLKESDSDWKLISIDSSFDVMYRNLALEDINGDGHMDILGKDGGGGHGASLSYFSIYDAKKKIFKYNPHFDGGYVTFDKCSKLVCKYYDQPYFAEKERYKIIGDSLQIVDAVRWSSEKSQTSHEIYKNGKLKSTKIIKEGVLQYFEKALWDYYGWKQIEIF